MSKNIFLTVTSFLIVCGVLITSVPRSPQNVLATRRHKPTLTPVPTTVVVTPTPGSINTPGGLYRNLSLAVLDSYKLAYHGFEGFNFSGASLRDADLRYSLFTNAKLDGADFTGSNLDKADITGATTVGTIWYSCPQGDGQCGSTTCPNGTQISTDGASCI